MDYVAVGTLERELYGAQVDSRFVGKLDPAYTPGQTGSTVLYRVGKPVA